MEVKAQDVKKLRDKTGAGMMDCKKALVEANGDFDKASKILKELGLAAAAKRSSKEAIEGRIFLKVKDNVAVLLELFCETDFVSRNQDFIGLGKELVDEIISKKLTSVSSELENKIKESQSKIKENMGLRRFNLMQAAENEILSGYIHGEGRIGVIVKLQTDSRELSQKEDVQSFAFDCALHAAAYNPPFLSEETVDKSYLDEQEEIFRKQAENLGKPEKVIEGIVKGKIKKHLSEICFLNQNFVKDNKRSVGTVASDLSKELGGKVSLVDYYYYSVGEILE